MFANINIRECMIFHVISIKSETINLKSILYVRYQWACSFTLSHDQDWPTATPCLFMASVRHFLTPATLLSIRKRTHLFCFTDFFLVASRIFWSISTTKSQCWSVVALGVIEVRPSVIFATRCVINVSLPASQQTHSRWEVLNLPLHGSICPWNEYIW